MTLIHPDIDCHNVRNGGHYNTLIDLEGIRSGLGLNSIYFVAYFQ